MKHQSSADGPWWTSKRVGSLKPITPSMPPSWRFMQKLFENRRTCRPEEFSWLCDEARRPAFGQFTQSYRRMSLIRGHPFGTDRYRCGHHRTDHENCAAQYIMRVALAAMPMFRDLLMQIEPGRPSTALNCLSRCRGSH